MPKSARGVAEAATNIHSRMKAIAEPVGALLVDAFHYLALFAIGATTVWSASTAFFGMVGKGRAELSDLLLLFIYLEIGAMVGIYFKTTELPVRYLIYIAITALGPSHHRDCQRGASNRDRSSDTGRSNPGFVVGSAGIQVFLQQRRSRSAGSVKRRRTAFAKARRCVADRIGAIPAKNDNIQQAFGPKP
jgi:hypothetical protein